MMSNIIHVIFFQIKQAYTSQALGPVLYIIWKLQRTKLQAPLF